MLLMLLFVKATLIVALASLGAWLFRRHSASVRYAMLAAAIGALLVIPFVTWSLPEWTVRVPASSRAPSSPASTAGVPPAPARSLDPAILETIRALSPLGAPTPHAQPLAAELEAPVDHRPWHLRPGIRFGVTAAWGAGALLLLLHLGLGLTRLAALTRGSPPADDRLRSMALRVASESGLRRTLQLRLTPRLPIPLTWGVIRPVILLPAEAARWSECRLRGVLLHEIAHVVRWDWVAHVLAEVTRAFYWPNPAVWHLAQRAGLAQEEACDNMVLRHGYRGSTYATELFDIARAAVAGSGRGSLLPGGGLPFAEPSSLRRRIASILSPVLPRDGLRMRPAVVLLAATVAIGLPVASLQAPGWGRFAAFEFALVNQAVQGESTARLAAIRGIGASGFALGLPVLVQAVTDDDPGVRIGAAEALTRVRGGRVFQGIVASLEHSDVEVRAGAVRVVRTMMHGNLTPIRTHALVEVLATRAALDPHPAVRGLALRSLAGLCDLSARNAILSGLEDGDPTVRAEAREAARRSQHFDTRLLRAVVLTERSEHAPVA